MPDPRFFSVSGPFALAELAEIAQASLADGTDPRSVIADVAALSTAGKREISFIDNPRYVEE